jgi:hypothetical protein
MINMRGITSTPKLSSAEAPANKSYCFPKNANCGFARNLSLDTLLMTAQTRSFLRRQHTLESKARQPPRGAPLFAYSRKRT